MKAKIEKTGEIVFIPETGLDCYDIGRLVRIIKERNEKYCMSYNHEEKTILQIEMSVKTIMFLLTTMDSEL